MTDTIHIALCKHHTENPKLAQKELVIWLQQTHNVKVSQGTVSNTLKRTVELLQLDMEVANPNSKRQRAVKYPMMESALIDWFKGHQERVNLSGDLVCEAAEKILNRLYPDHDVFKFSNGWLEAFKKRHGIRSYRRFGESGSVNMETIESNLPRLRETLDKFQWKDIYNIDETGLFFRMQVDNSLATRQLEGHKQNKVRITVAVCCNGDGTHKLPLWIIGKYANPICFKNVNRANLGCEYRNNSKAWMTQVIFLEWLKDFDRCMTNRKVLLILDNCNAHVPIDELPDRINLHNTTVFYLPPNTTSKIQPCDQGIIRNFKAYYRRSFNRLLLQRLDAKVDQPEKIDVLEAIQLAVPAWSTEVKAETIHNCFRHCKIRSEPTDVMLVEEEHLMDHTVIEELELQICQFHYSNPMDIRNLLDYPDEQEVAFVLDVDDVVQAQLDGMSSGNEIVEADDEDDNHEHPEINPVDAHLMLQILETFWLHQDEDSQEFIRSLQQMKNKINKIRVNQMVQTDIRKFFNRS